MPPRCLKSGHHSAWGTRSTDVDQRRILIKRPVHDVGKSKPRAANPGISRWPREPSPLGPELTRWRPRPYQIRWPFQGPAPETAPISHRVRTYSGPKLLMFGLIDILGSCTYPRGTANATKFEYQNSAIR